MFIYIYLHETALRNPWAQLTVALHCYYYFSHSCHSHHRPQIGEHASPARSFITSFLLTFPISSLTHPFLLYQNHACRGWHGQSLMGVQINCQTVKEKKLDMPRGNYCQSTMWNPRKSVCIFYVVYFPRNVLICWRDLSFQMVPTFKCQYLDVITGWWVWCDHHTGSIGGPLSRIKPPKLQLQN